MKRWIGVICLTLLLLPVTAGAQGYGGDGGYGATSNQGGAWSLLGSTGQILGSVTRMQVGWPSVSVSWLESRKGLVFGGRFTQGGTDIGLDTAVPTKGLWLGASQTIYPAAGVRLVLQGQYLFPTNQKFSYFLNHFAAPAFSEVRPWDSKGERWYVEGTGYYQLSDNLSALAGLRYDYQYVLGSNPPSTVLGGFLVTSIPQDQMDVTLKSPLPYIGLRYEFGSESTSVSAEIRGFPTIPLRGEVGLTTATGLLVPTGTRRWTFSGAPKSAYFLEGLLKYSFQFYGSRLNLFSTMSLIHAQNLKGGLEVAGDAGPDPVVPPTSFPSEWSIDRLEISAGGEISLAF